MEGRDLPHRVVHHAAAIDNPVAGEILLNSENEIVGDGVLENESAPVSVFRNMREAGIVSLRDTATRDVDAIDQDVAGENRPQTGEHLDQLSLSVSLDAGDAEYLPRLHAEVDTVDHADAARSRDAEIPHVESLIRLRTCGTTARLNSLPGGERNFTTHHQARDFSRRGVRRLDARDRLAPTHHRDRVRKLHDFIEPVRDENDRRPVVTQATEHGPQLAN